MIAEIMRAHKEEIMGKYQKKIIKSYKEEIVKSHYRQYSEGRRHTMKKNRQSTKSFERETSSRNTMLHSLAAIFNYWVQNSAGLLGSFTVRLGYASGL